MTAGAKIRFAESAQSLPPTWASKQLKRVVHLVNDKTTSNDRPYVGLENIEPATGRLIESAAANPEGVSCRFLQGDVLFGKLRPYLAKVFAPTSPGRCTSELLVLRPGEVTAEFLKYVLLSDWFIKLVDSSTFGVKMPRADWEFIGNVMVPIPPPAVQREIAVFLDRKTAVVDGLIKKKERLIELLQEKRQALVIQAVTKGIDQNAPMKDSGVDWIGAIPRHWRLLPVKRIGWFTGGAGFPDEEQGRLSLDLPFYKVKDLGSGAIDFPESADNTIDKQTARRLHATIFPAGSIVFAKIGAALLLRRFRTLKVPACIDNNMMGWVPDERLVDPCYAHLATALLPFDLLVNPGTVPSLSGASFGAQLIPVPELNEQRRICEHVTAATLEADKLIALNQEVVTRLREYRQTLISAAVTGQLDLSKEAA